MAVTTADGHVILRDVNFSLGPHLDTLLQTIRLKGSDLSKITLANCAIPDAMMDKIRTVISYHAPHVQLSVLSNASPTDSPYQSKISQAPSMSPKVRSSNAFLASVFGSSLLQ
jgi:hypothetical protein